MNSLLELLHPIDGVDTISPWPLAMGWWVVIAVSLILTAVLAVFIAYRIAFLRSWRNDTLKKLAALENNLSETTAYETVISLSEYLRRIALKRFSRRECAGLMGQAWLQWLTKHDPRGYDWESRGLLLIEMPYAPPHTKLSISQIRDLIKAVKLWVTY